MEQKIVIKIKLREYETKQRATLKAFGLTYPRQSTFQL